MKRSRLVFFACFAVGALTGAALAAPAPQRTPAPQETPAPQQDPAAAAPAAAPAPAPAAQTADLNPAVPAGSLILMKKVPFAEKQPIRLDMVVGNLRVPELKITPTEARLVDQVLPPRGGHARFSWLNYAVSAENPSAQEWTLAVRIRLLDRSGAVIDEFEFSRDIGAGKAKAAELRRLTLNYAVQYVDQVEVTLSAER